MSQQLRGLHHPKKKASCWPEWDGTKESYDMYTMQLTNKIESDWDLLGGHKSVCMDMINTLPKNMRGRVSHWASTGGPKSDWNYETFISHFNDNFEDKTSTRAAGEKLSRMRQGQHQTFASYLNDFEYMLALAKGVHWEGRIKIKDLSLGLNDRLTDLLMTVTLSDENYTLFVKEVRTIAGRLESRENYVPKIGPRYTKTWYISRLGNAPSNSGNSTGHVQRAFTSMHQEVTPPYHDADGDTQMSGVNGISTSALAAIINAVNSQTQSRNKGANKKPPAPWRAREEYTALRAAGKCTRCAQKGHWHKNCPSFTWPVRPAAVNAASTRDNEEKHISGDFEEDCNSVHSGNE